MSIPVDQKEWRRRHDDPLLAPIVSNPIAHFYPKSKPRPLSRKDLIDIVNCSLDVKNCQLFPSKWLGQPGHGPVREGVPKIEVRASGSHWALSEAAVTDKFIVETHGLNKTLYDVIPSCLSKEAFDQLVIQGPRDQQYDYTQPQIYDYATSIEDQEAMSFNYYHVEAGIRIYDLYSRLDGQSAGEEMPTQHDPLTKKNKYLMGPWAMPTLGAAGGQTIVGAFSTGTHGADLYLPPIADAVQAIHLIGSDGKEYWIERDYSVMPQATSLGAHTNFTLTDDKSLVKVYPGIHIIRDQSVFDAVLVSAGRMGIIYSVVLKVVRQYGLQRNGEKSSWKSVRNWITNFGDQHFQHRNLGIAVNPNAKPDDATDHTCYVAWQDAIGIPDPFPATWTGRTQRAGLSAGKNSSTVGFSLFSWICSQSSVASIAQQLIAFIEAIKAGAALISGFIDALGGLIGIPLGAGAAVGGAIVATATTLEGALTPFLTQGRLGDLIKAIVDASLATPVGPTLLQELNEVLMGAIASVNAVTDISYAVLDTYDYTPDLQCETKGDSLTVSFDAESMDYVGFMENLFQRMVALNNGTLVNPRTNNKIAGKLGFGGYISVRFTNASTASIAMQQWSRTCNIEIAGLNIDGTDDFLSTLEWDAANMGATIHWGQKNNEPATRVEQNFKRLDEWRNALALFTANGKLTNFSTHFSWLRGLEVVQPKIASFQVQPILGGRVTQKGGIVKGVIDVGATVTWDASDNPPGTTLLLHLDELGNNVVYPSLPLKGNMKVNFSTNPRSISSLKLVASYTFPPDGITREDTKEWSEVIPGG